VHSTPKNINFQNADQNSNRHDPCISLFFLLASSVPIPSPRFTASFRSLFLFLRESESCSLLLDVGFQMCLPVYCSPSILGSLRSKCLRSGCLFHSLFLAPLVEITLEQLEQYYTQISKTSSVGEDGSEPEGQGQTARTYIYSYKYMYIHVYI